MSSQPPLDPRLTAITNCLYRVSAKAVIVKNRQLLMVVEEKKHYGLPGGGIDYGEPIPTALLREVKEEVGLDGQDLSLEPLPAYIADGGVFQGVPKLALLYRITLQNADAALRPAELKTVWIDATRLASLPLQPSIESARIFLLQLLEQA